MAMPWAVASISSHSLPSSLNAPKSISALGKNFSRAPKELNIFKNYGRIEELEEFGRLYGEKIAALKKSSGDTSGARLI